MRKSISLKDLLYNKKFLVTISLLISVIAWFIVTLVRNPTKNQVFNDVSAKFNIEGTSAQNLGLGIVSDVSSYNFTVTLNGPNYLVSGLKTDDFLLTVSPVDVNAPGTYSLEVHGDRNSDKKGYTFVSIEPSRIDVTFDYIDTKQFDITPKIVGISATDGLIAETPIISEPEKTSITIKGPRTIMDKVASVGAIYEAEDRVLNSSQTFDCDIALYNASDNIIYRYSSNGDIFDQKDNKIERTNLTLSFSSVKVTQPISKKAKLAVKPNFTNMPSGIASVINYSVNHSYVNVIGTPEVVDKMTEISLSNIDFRNVSSASGNFEVSAVLPDGIKVLDNIEYFKVSIDVSDFAEKTLNIQNIKYTGLSNNYSVKTSAVKNVKICGPKDVIENIKASDLYGEINISDKNSGEHTADVTVKSDVYNNIWQVGTYDTSVVISNK